MSSWQIRKIKYVLDSAKQDADVQTTVASAQTKHTILVGYDTDLLVLLLHPDIDANNIFVSPENTQTSKTEKVWCYNSARLGEHARICYLCMQSLVVKLQVVSLDWAKEL